MIHQLIDLWFRGWRSLIEILLLSAAIYYGYLYFRGTRGAKVLTGLAIVFLTLTLISTLLNLVVIGWIVRSFSVFLAVALVVIFQPELRRGLAALGGHPIFSLTSEKRETVHAAGWDVEGWTASEESAAALSAKPYPACQVDISNHDQVAEHPGTFDAVIHCASSRGGGVEFYRQIYLNGARNLLDRFAETKLLFTSSTSVYGQCDGSCRF